MHIKKTLFKFTNPVKNSWVHGFLHCVDSYFPQICFLSFVIIIFLQTRRWQGQKFLVYTLMYTPSIIVAFDADANNLVR